MARPKSVHRIGDLAEATGVTVDTLRYYEREGLLPRVERTAGGFRCYSQETAHRLRFIKQARELGLTLSEIRQLVEPTNDRCSAVRQVLADRLSDVDRRLRDLASFRKTLKTALAQCEASLERSKNPSCPAVRQLGT
jgi:MerR family transcriptional regulator, copper efflux regulator